jgi:hypothetical protein
VESGRESTYFDLYIYVQDIVNICDPDVCVNVAYDSNILLSMGFR